MEDRRVVLDADFINALTQYRDSAAVDFFQRLFQAIKKEPVVHPYVFECELMHNAEVEILVDRGLLHVIPKEEFCPDDNEYVRMHYCESFNDVYRKIMGGSLSEIADGNIEDVIFSRHAQHSFGEIHSVLMATELKIPLFYSNDHGAKIAASAYTRGRLTVCNIREVADDLKDAAILSGKEKRYMKKFQRK